MGSPMKKTKESEHYPTTVNMISQLPDNVVDKILISMTIVEAARTAILSRNWKRGWKNISKLVFDSSFGTKFEKDGRPNLMLAIYQTLFLHLGGIDGFTLSIPWLESCAEINPLFQFLSEKKVKHLKIHFTNGDFHVLPSYLFSCSQLSTLDLAGCVFSHLHCFGGFSQLTTLVLKEVYITNAHRFFGMLIFNCPLIQQLKLLDCTFGEVSSINIIAPNLRTFLYDGCDLFIYFVSAPLLEQLECFMPGSGRRLNFDRLKKLHLDEFCSAVPALRNLDVNNFFLKILVRSGQPPYCLQQLKVFNVYHICLTDLEDVSVLVGLIRRSPNLVQFSAQMRECDVEGPMPISPIKILEPDQYDFSCNRLETVLLLDFNGTDPEMEFVQFLLSKSPQLKDMTIYQASKDDQKAMQILTKMIRFQRASTVADIDFRGPREDPV